MHRCRGSDLRSSRAGEDTIGTPHDVMPVQCGRVWQRKHRGPVSGDLPGNGSLRMRLLRFERQVLVRLGTELLLVPVRSSVNVLLVGMAAGLLLPGCAGRTTGSSEPDSGSSGGSSSGGSSGDDSSPACVTPPEHRSRAVACPSHTDGGAACSNSTQCQPDAGQRAPWQYCFQGGCGVDQCLTDSDCASNQVCACAGLLSGPLTRYAANICVPAGCHVDSDCGPCGYCSPSADPICGPSYGARAYGCHKPGNACGRDTDCGPSTGSVFSTPFCAYDPMTGGWSCSTSYCGG